MLRIRIIKNVKVLVTAKSQFFKPIAPLILFVMSPDYDDKQGA
jgi:hypothetical protein